MYEHILVALDGSVLAEQVLPHVQALASKFGSQVTLLRATTPAIDLLPPGAVGMPAGDLTAYGRVPPELAYDQVESAINAEAQEAAAYLERVAKRLREAGVEVHLEYPNDRATDAIVDRANALGAGLIAMTTHGRGGLARALLGSVADEVVRRSRCPVLLVRINEDEAAPEGDNEAIRTEGTATGGNANG
jgi:nucleotide-binding universal stress UspA family protein